MADKEVAMCHPDRRGVVLSARGFRVGLMGMSGPPVPVGTIQEVLNGANGCVLARSQASPWPAGAG